jgi:hypothetical protein
VVNKNDKKRLSDATLASVIKEMAKPRLSASAARRITRKSEWQELKTQSWFTEDVEK